MLHNRDIFDYRSDILKGLATRLVSPRSPYSVLLLCMALLAACSEDSEWTGKVVDNVEVKLYTTGYEEENDMCRMGNAEPWDATRSWAPPTSPTNYVLYSTIYGDNGMFANQKNLVNKSISAFFTQNSETPQTATFFFRNTDNTWQMRTDDEDGLENGNYYLYGFIPKEDAASASIVSYNGTSANGDNSYSNGAVLTIHGLNALTPSDVCVIVGAKDDPTWQTSYDSDETGHTVDGLQAGHFDVSFQGGESAKNYLFLLFDHLYSAIRFRFTIDSEYAKLRTIRLRKLELVAYSDDHGGAVKAKYNATITLLKNNSGTSPIVGDVVFEPDNSSANVAPVPIYDWEDDPAKYVTLTTDEPQQFMGCFVPGDHTYFKLRTTYDVFDKNQAIDKNGNLMVDGNGDPVYNLIRQQCQAENTFDLRSKFDSYMSTVRGQRYSYTITVSPTYLYVLSEPDLDNPTLTIN